MKNVGNSYLEELLNTDPFEPTFIYDTLKHCGMIKNDAQRGHQEDAEEFLSSVLNGLNEEMIHLSKLLDETNEKKTNGYSSSDKSASMDSELDDQLGLCHDVDDDGVQDSSNDIWHEVGNSKHKSLPTRSVRDFLIFFTLLIFFKNQAKTFSTSITQIFGGSTLDIRTVNKDKDSCGNRQPFFTLQLDIKVNSLLKTFKLFAHFACHPFISHHLSKLWKMQSVGKQNPRPYMVMCVRKQSKLSMLVVKCFWRIFRPS